jgi:hypothetical protein
MKAEAEFLSIRYNPRDTCDEGTSIAARISERTVRLNVSLCSLRLLQENFIFSLEGEAEAAGEKE